MSSLSRLRRFFSRHQNKFIIGGIVVGGVVLLSKYAQKKLLDWQETQAKETIERMVKQNHFDATEKNCNKTILNLEPILQSFIMKSFDIESTLAELKVSGKHMRLWNTLKVLVFAKAAALIYCHVILIVIMKIQLNIVGGYMYKNIDMLSAEMQKKYLTQCYSLLDNAGDRLATILKDKVDGVLQNVSLKQQLNIADVEQLFWSVQTSICASNDDPIQNLRSYFAEEQEGSSSQGGLYGQMIAETRELLSTDDVQSVATSCVARGFGLLMDTLADVFIPSQMEGSGSSSFTEPSLVVKPLAKVVPLVNRTISDASFSVRIAEMLITDEKLRTLGANVFESFCS